jgi:hypothetical protein
MEKIYICPMHPEIQHKNSGKCLKCGMKLVLKRESGEVESNGFFGFCPSSLRIVKV